MSDNGLVVGSYVNVGNIYGQLISVERLDDEPGTVLGFVVECLGECHFFNIDGLLEEACAEA